LIQLTDRNIISDEFLQKRFGADPEMERIRLNRESKDRTAERMVQKMGPYNNIENDMKKIALQLGLVAPSEVGLDLIEKKKGQKTLLEIRNELDIKKSKEIPKPSQTQPPAGRSGQGRPQSKKDNSKRKTKQFAPQTGASLILSAHTIQDNINTIANPILLNFYKKKNMRSLSNEEYNEAEIFKTKLLFTINPGEKYNEKTIMENIKLVDSINPIYGQYQYFVKNLEKGLGKKLSIEENKQAKAYFYSLVYSEY
jgi:hypothetical protein